MEVRDAELGEVVDMGGDAAQVTREAIGVRRVPEHPRTLVPVGFEHPGQVEVLQLRRSGGERSCRQSDEAHGELVGDGRLVRRSEPVAEVLPPPHEASAEHVDLVVGQPVQVHSGDGQHVVRHRTGSHRPLNPSRSRRSPPGPGGGRRRRGRSSDRSAGR